MKSFQAKDIQKLVEESLRLTILATVPYEFRTTCAKPFVNQEMIQGVCEIIKGADNNAQQSGGNPGLARTEPGTCAVGKVTDQGIRDGVENSRHQHGSA